MLADRNPDGQVEYTITDERCYFLDSCAILAWLLKEVGGEAVEKLVDQLAFLRCHGFSPSLESAGEM